MCLFVQVKVQASDVEGLYYALTTVTQLLRAYGSTGVPQIKVGTESRGSFYCLESVYICSIAHSVQAQTEV